MSNSEVNLKLNAKVVGFNINTHFNDSFDALLIAKIADFPENEVLPMMRTNT